MLPTGAFLVCNSGSQARRRSPFALWQEDPLDKASRALQMQRDALKYKIGALQLTKLSLDPFNWLRGVFQKAAAQWNEKAKKVGQEAARLFSEAQDEIRKP